MPIQIFVLTSLTILISAFVILVFGYLGLCIMSASQGSGSASIEDKLFGAAVAMAASLPLAASLTVLIAHLRKTPPGSTARALIWSVVAITALLGVYQVLTDPGDAVWAGLPLIIVSALLAVSLWSLPESQ